MLHMNVHLLLARLVGLLAAGTGAGLGIRAGANGNNEQQVGLRGEGTFAVLKRYGMQRLLFTPAGWRLHMWLATQQHMLLMHAAIIV